MPWSTPTSDRFVQNTAQFCFHGFAWEKSVKIIKEYEGLSLVDMSFALLGDSPRPLKKTGHVALFHYSIISHGGQCDTK